MSIANARMPIKPIFTSFFIFIKVLLVYSLFVVLKFLYCLVYIHFFPVLKSNNECSFKFAYNSPVKVLPLSKIGWSSSGGSVTSTANPHIHPMSNTVVDELAYYVNQTNDGYVRNRMLDTVMWGCQTYNTYDKEYGYGKKGWMSERFCYSQGLVVEKYPDGTPAGTWFALMPWAGASILEGMVGEYWK